MTSGKNQRATRDSRCKRCPACMDKKRKCTHAGELRIRDLKFPFSSTKNTNLVNHFNVPQDKKEKFRNIIIDFTKQFSEEKHETEQPHKYMNVQYYDKLKTNLEKNGFQAASPEESRMNGTGPVSSNQKVNLPGPTDQISMDVRNELGRDEEMAESSSNHTSRSDSPSPPIQPQNPPSNGLDKTTAVVQGVAKDVPIGNDVSTAKHVSIVVQNDGINQHNHNTPTSIGKPPSLRQVSIMPPPPSKRHDSIVTAAITQTPVARKDPVRQDAEPIPYKLELSEFVSFANVKVGNSQYRIRFDNTHFASTQTLEKHLANATSTKVTHIFYNRLGDSLKVSDGPSLYYLSMLVRWSETSNVVISCE